MQKSKRLKRRLRHNKRGFNSGEEADKDLKRYQEGYDKTVNISSALSEGSEEGRVDLEMLRRNYPDDSHLLSYLCQENAEFQEHILRYYPDELCHRA